MNQLPFDSRDRSDVLRDTCYSFDKKCNSLALRKTQNIYIANSLERLGEFKLASKVRGCHSNATYYPATNGGLTGVSPYGENHVCRCGQRFCPVCALFESRKTMNSVFKFVEQLGGNYVFITFSVRNVQFCELRATVQYLNSVYRELTMRNGRHLCKFGKAFDGTVRRIEVTYNADSNTYHPHMHILAHCSDNYFNDPSLYFNQKDGKLELANYFSRKAGLNYVASCDIRRVRSNNIANACSEISKYAFKIDDSLFSPDKHEQLDSYIKGILSLRKVSMTGAGGSLKGILYFVQKCEDEATFILGTKSSLSLNFVQYRWNYARSGFNVVISYSYDCVLDHNPDDDTFFFSRGVPDKWFNHDFLLHNLYTSFGLKKN